MSKTGVTTAITAVIGTTEGMSDADKRLGAMEGMVMIYFSLSVISRQKYLKKYTCIYIYPYI